MPAISIEEALKQFDKRYSRLILPENIVESFLVNTRRYVEKVNNAIKQNEFEEHLKNITNQFLKSSLYYKDDYEINTEGRIDSVIKVNGKTQILIENKKPSNKNEMATDTDINVKALHELLFYYMKLTRDTNENKVKRITDIEIRRVIITDTIRWVIIDANNVEKLVDGYLEKLFYKYQNNQLIYSNNADKFYEDTKTYLSTINVNEHLKYVYFEINNYMTVKKISYLYKILYKNYLLKENVKNQVSTHVLNEKFYQELLYIMGLKEKSGKSSKTIEIDFTITNSLAFQVYNVMKNDKEYDEISCIEKTFELVIIWMNRLLFIKLFEGQLISFNGDTNNYHILDNDKIQSFQNLQDLFFEILGKRKREDTEFLNQFSDIPYLNSSLFERSEIERQDMNINSLKNEKIPVKKKSILGNVDEINILEYIISFLNSYNFSSQKGKNDTLIKGRDIIDASVLGLIFEKLNGYRDGSFYTPSVITEYMCMKSVEKAIINQINNVKHWDCKDLFELKNKIQPNLVETKEINNIINTVKICDISVGSGHFLVSALNRIIYIKKYLGVLFKYGKNELLTEYDIDIIDDVLHVFNGQGKLFFYDKDNSLSQIVQETLFNEKRIIIENCIYGVDLNSKAVAICQLRLWIELLKNAYYKNGIMETLPNIDINIKVGNSLVSKLEFSIGKKIGGNNLGLEQNTIRSINQYKKLVASYKATSDKAQKSEIKRQISSIKDYLHGIYSQIRLVMDNENNTIIDYGDTTGLYTNAFEWAIEFPELLTEKGEFMGFDCVVGNPPYGLLNKKQNQNTSISVSSAVLGYYKENVNYQPAKGGVLNIYRLFICRCFELLRPKGHCCLIFPLAFMCDSTNAAIRKYVMENTQIDFIEAFPERDNESKRVFKEVKMSVCILGATKKRVDESYRFKVRIHGDNYVDENNETMNISYKEIKTIDNEYCSIPLIRDSELAVFLKMTSKADRMKKYSKCYTGEIDISLDKKYITTSSEDNLMLRGAQVQKYYLTDDISQGDILYLKADSYLQNNIGERSNHHKKRRIVMQGITGINEKWRLKMAMAQPPYFCANSVNYLIPTPENNFDYLILGILNSKLLNWYFAKMSTNSNVNGYEIDSLPIRLGNEEQQLRIKELVSLLLDKPDEGYMKEIDEIIYDIYNISEYEIPMIEGKM
ncbi:MAG: Eco57I restriction-modification methylase domain-containing protein [Roseburia sp.]|nr:Eco57I restriction-modification methylase domain-containing protein [Roseburia sp.]